jgi:hypothetical protein
LKRRRKKQKKTPGRHSDRHTRQKKEVETKIDRESAATYKWTKSGQNQYKFYRILYSAFSKSGTDVMIFKIFSPKNSAKKLAF